MTVQEILAEFEEPKRMPAAAIVEARRQREEITPVLLRILEESADRPETLEQGNETFLPLFALFLLSEFQEPRAHVVMGRLFALPEGILDVFLGDTITESVPQMLAATWSGDDSVIRGLIEDRHASEWIRSSALRALVCLWARGMKTREDLLDYMQTLMEGGIEREPSHLWVCIACVTADLALREIVSTILEAFDQGLVSELSIGREEFERDASRPGPIRPENSSAARNYKPFSTVEEEMGWWSCWRVSDQKAKRPPSIEKDDVGLPFKPVQTIVRGGPKVGRNETCPCGSGKKYKKCCGGGPT